MVLTWFEQGFEKELELAREQQLERGKRKLTLAVLEKRLGPLSQELRRCVEEYPEDKLVELIDQAYKAQSMDERNVRGADRNV